jgi:hypothetical protein
MIKGTRGQVYQFRFIFVRQGQLYDPVNAATPSDVKVNVYRSEYGSGPLIDGPYSYFNQSSPPDSDTYIDLNSNGEFSFFYKIPDTLFEGIYTIVATTSDDFGLITVTSKFQVSGNPSAISPIVISKNSKSVVNYKPSYSQMNSANTSTLLLVGHSDGIAINEPVRITDMQSAIDLLGGDISSPLMRGVLDAYGAGARDIMVCAAAPMSEYVSDYSNRLVSTGVFELDEATPSSKTFYEKYYERLEETYQKLVALDFVDLIVPLETSIINTGGVDFITQLADHCMNFHNATGNVQIGFIGSVSGGVSSDDIQKIKDNSAIVNKLSAYNSDGTLASDSGRFVVPLYGEAVMQHPQISVPYISSAAAAYAGLVSATDLSTSVIRKRIPNMLSLHGSDLSQSEYSELDEVGVNALYRGRQSRYNTPYYVYVTDEYTLANPMSTLSKLTQMRLVARTVSEIKDYARDAIGKFGYDKLASDVDLLLDSYKKSNYIIDYSVKIEPVLDAQGEFIFYVELLSAFGLKAVNFALSAGPVV